MNTIVGDAQRGQAKQPDAQWASDRSDAADDGLEPDFKPLTPEQAQAWRQKQVQMSPWRVLLLQLIMGVVLAVLTGWVSGQFRLAASVAWGALSVVLPGLVFARALARQMRHRQAGAALVGLFLWEGVKIILTIALLLVAPKVVAGLSWLALVAGFVVTMKVYWLAMAFNVVQGRNRRNAST